MIEGDQCPSGRISRRDGASWTQHRTITGGPIFAGLREEMHSGVGVTARRNHRRSKVYRNVRNGR